MWEKVIRFGQNQNLASLKHSISYGYDCCNGVIAGVLHSIVELSHAIDLLVGKPLASEKMTWVRFLVKSNLCLTFSIRGKVWIPTLSGKELPVCLEYRI